jgi:hypothetical protein
MKPASEIRPLCRRSILLGELLHVCSLIQDGRKKRQRIEFVSTNGPSNDEEGGEDEGNKKDIIDKLRDEEFQNGSFPVHVFEKNISTKANDREHYLRAY